MGAACTGEFAACSARSAAPILLSCQGVATAPGWRAAAPLGHAAPAVSAPRASWAAARPACLGKRARASQEFCAAEPYPYDPFFIPFVSRIPFDAPQAHVEELKAAKEDADKFAAAADAARELLKEGEAIGVRIEGVKEQLQVRAALLRPPAAPGFVSAPGAARTVCFQEVCAVAAQCSCLPTRAALLVASCADTPAGAFKAALPVQKAAAGGRGGGDLHLLPGDLPGWQGAGSATAWPGVHNGSVAARHES